MTTATASLLVELLTEELPPKALPRLGETFATRIAEGLKARGLAPLDAALRSYASPRRLAVTVAHVAAEGAAREVTEKLMPVSVALDAEGKPTPALLKKMEAKGISVDAVASFERRVDGKAEALFHTDTVAGARLADVLAAVVQDAIKALPIPKVMRWGDGDATFVRPVHKLTMLHGADVVPGRVLDLENSQSGAWPSPSGNFVRVLHSDASTGVYLHLSRGSVRVQVGQQVMLGSVLGLSGNTGHSNGPHLHFVVQRNSGLGWVSIPFQFNQPLQGLPNFALGR